MKKYYFVQFMLLIGFVEFQMACSHSKADLADVNLVPWPGNIQIKNATIAIGSRLIMINPSGREDIDNIIKTCTDDFSEVGYKIINSREKKAYSGNVTQIFFILENDSTQNYGDEGYRLCVDKHISVFATDKKGMFWGSRTLLQLLHNGPGYKIPKLDISDKPSFKYRGLMIDAARNFHKIEFHIEMIKKISYYKLNNYMIHFSDNESYTLPSDRFPGLPTQGRHYTKEEIRTLVKTADDYNINIVPSVDVPGHSGALIRSIPELKFDDEQIRIDISKEESYRILQSIFEELMELFPGPLWHLGADEVDYPDKKEGPGKDYSRFMDRINISGGDQLQNYFINRMYDFFKGKGYGMLVWEGFKPDIKPLVNHDIIVCPFNIKYEGTMPGDYIKAGYKILNTSWSPLYIAGKTSMTTPETFAMWTPYMFGAGRSPWPFKYWLKFKPTDISTEIIGAQACSWANEEKAEMGLLFGQQAGPGYPEYGRPGPRVQIFSERVWTLDSTTAKDLLERTGAAYWD
jgi:hypothetical protein